MMGPEQRLFVYGTLAPGQANAHILERVEGNWRRAQVRARLYPPGTPPIIDYPVIIADESADWIDGWLLESSELAALWPSLDRFETEAYRRERVAVRCGDDELLEATTYTLNQALDKKEGEG